MATFLAAAGSGAGATAAGIGASTSLAATAGLVTPAASAATSLLPTAATMANIMAGASAIAQIRSGQAADMRNKAQAEQIKQDAINKEVNRRRRLVSSLASQNATRAASGIAFFEGSSADMALEDIRVGEGAILTGRAAADSAAGIVSAEGGYARRTGVIGASASLLDQANRVRTRD